MERQKIESQFKWTIDEMYPSESDLNKDIEKVKELVEKVVTYKGKLSESKSNLYEALHTSEEAGRILEKLYVYTHMKSHEDTRINENQGKATKIDMLSTELSMATSYMVPEIISMDESKLNEYLQDEKLAFYKKYIDEILRVKPHTLSETEEEILAAASDLTAVPENVYDMMSYADMKFPEIEDEEGKKVRLTHANFSLFLKSKDRRVRKDAFEGLYSVYEQYRNTFASTLYGGVKSEIFYAKIRKYESALQGSLFADNISVDVYENLIKSVSESIPALDKYIDLKKKFLGLDDIHMYDLYVPLTGDFDMKITYDEAKEIILEALKPLGEEYLSHIKDAFENGWIDVYENEGKQGGAYSWGCYDSKSYILMNYHDDLNSLFTLIHELGHSMHSTYSKSTQDYLYSSYKIFVAEVASTLNELLLINYLLKKSTSKEEKIYLLNYYLEQFRTTVYRQTMFAEFEKNIYEKHEKGEILTAELLCNDYYELNKKYFGNSVYVDDEIKYEWERIPHFYYYFYVYKYATGLSAACYIVNSILSGSKDALDNYLKFLTLGGSMDPLDELKVAGIDMTKPEAILSAIHMFDEILEEFEQLYNA